MKFKLALKAICILIALSVLAGCGQKEVLNSTPTPSRINKVTAIEPPEPVDPFIKPPLFWDKNKFAGLEKSDPETIQNTELGLTDAIKQRVGWENKTWESFDGGFLEFPLSNGMPENDSRHHVDSLTLGKMGETTYVLMFTGSQKSAIIDRPLVDFEDGAYGYYTNVNGIKEPHVLMKQTDEGLTIIDKDNQKSYFTKGAKLTNLVPDQKFIASMLSTDTEGVLPYVNFNGEHKVSIDGMVLDNNSIYQWEKDNGWVPMSLPKIADVTLGEMAQLNDGTLVIRPKASEAGKIPEPVLIFNVDEKVWEILFPETSMKIDDQRFDVQSEKLVVWDTEKGQFVPADVPENITGNYIADHLKIVGNGQIVLYAKSTKADSKDIVQVVRWDSKQKTFIESGVKLTEAEQKIMDRMATSFEDFYDNYEKYTFEYEELEPLLSSGRLAAYFNETERPLPETATFPSDLRLADLMGNMEVTASFSTPVGYYENNPDKRYYKIIRFLRVRFGDIAAIMDIHHFTSGPGKNGQDLYLLNVRTNDDVFKPERRDAALKYYGDNKYEGLPFMKFKGFHGSGFEKINQIVSSLYTKTSKARKEISDKLISNQAIPPEAQNLIWVPNQ